VSLPAIGEEVTLATYGPLTRTDIVRYAGASGDFLPLHHDEQLAQSAGFPTIFAMGMFPASLLATCATDWLGATTIRSFRIRFKEQVWPGDVLHCTGSVTDVQTEQDGTSTVSVSLAARREAGGVAISSTATFVLPA
jgi:acyl dehydratase